VFSNLSSEVRFIIIGIFYISILNILSFVKIFDLFTFFAIYGCYKHLKSKPNFNKKRLIISLLMIIILILEFVNLFGYIFVCFRTLLNELDGGVVNRSISIIASFCLGISYNIYNLFKTNPKNNSQIIKEFFIEYYQLFLILICYIFITKAVITKHFFEHIAILVVISFMILISTNILNKKSSLVLEILGFSYLFFVFATNYLIYYYDREVSKNGMQLSIDNNMAIFIIFINIIIITLIFLSKKNTFEKAKIFLLILLIISLFIPDNSIFCFIFYITSSIILPILIIYYKKLSIFHVKILFIILNIIMFLISAPFTAGRGGMVGYNLIILSLINIAILLTINFVSNFIAQKKQAKNNIIS
jgi:hypothetical protein